MTTAATPDLDLCQLSAEDVLAVLVVDDDPLIIDMIAAGLPRFGFVTLTASSAAEAKRLIADRRDIGVVVSDIAMPWETGLALARELLRDRVEDEALEVILMTGRSKTEDAIAALRSHVADFVSKPFGMRELADSVRRALRSALTRRESAARTRDVATRMAEAEDERQRLMATLNQANADLVASNRTRNDLIAMVSHELRTPLIPIIGFAESMRRSATVSPEDQLSWAATIEENGRRLLSMINGALEIVSLDQGKLPPRRTGIILDMLLGRVAASHRRLAMDCRVRTVVKAEGGLLIDVDPKTIEVAIGHLVDNAIRASPVAETVKIASWGSADSISIAVSDRGPGVARTVMEKLGTPFLQGDLSYGRKWEGVGLGLALATRIVRAHGGRLSLAPRLDGGTVALIELPLPESDEPPMRVTGARQLARDAAAGGSQDFGELAQPVDHVPGRPVHSD